MTVTLSSTDSSTLTISPTTVTIAAGQTTPPTQPQISGVKLGTATINASAPGFTSSSVLVQVNATVNFTPGTLTINGFNTQNLTLNLSTQAPAGGITINLSSSTPATATVPSTVSFAAGATTVSVPVTGLAFGTTVIHASAAPNIADATANVTVQSAGTITVPASTSVSLGTGGTLAISLPAPAAAPVTVTVVSSDPSKVLVSAGPFTIAQGATTPATQPQLTGVNIGSVTITASAPGYASGTGTAQTTATVSFSPPTTQHCRDRNPEYPSEPLGSCAIHRLDRESEFRHSECSYGAEHCDLPGIGNQYQCTGNFGLDRQRGNPCQRESVHSRRHRYGERRNHRECRGALERHRFHGFRRDADDFSVGARTLGLNGDASQQQHQHRDGVAHRYDRSGCYDARNPANHYGRQDRDRQYHCVRARLCKRDNSGSS